MIRFKSYRTVSVVVTVILSCFLAARAQQVPSTQQKTTDKAPRSAQIALPSPSAKLSSEAAIDESYRIGVEDELQISVWHEPELSVQVVVRPDGVITVPLLNDVQVVGLSTLELGNLLSEKLKPFVTEPQVTIVVKAIRSRRVYLVGQVARPGAMPLNGKRSVMELLAEAGGLTQYAKAKGIYVIRNNNGKTLKMPFNYKEALKGNVKADFEVAAGDMIVVP